MSGQSLTYPYAVNRPRPPALTGAIWAALYRFGYPRGLVYACSIGEWPPGAAEALTA